MPQAGAFLIFLWRSLASLPGAECPALLMHSLFGSVLHGVTDFLSSHCLRWQIQVKTFRVVSPSL